MVAFRTRSSFTPTTFSIWILVLAAGRVLAQGIGPSNATNDLPPDGTTRFLLELAPRSTIRMAPTLHLVPLTDGVATMSNSEFLNVNLTSRLLAVTANNLDSIDSDTIAYINCDDSAYSGNIKATGVFNAAKMNNPVPRSIVLWAPSADHCTLSNQGNFNNDPIFTTVSPGDASLVSSLIANNSQPNGWSLLPDTSVTTSSGNGPRGPGSNNAMIILYSITGIITALFLIIIVTGAIRAHRHPERYGPRNVIGRPRQSRAKGIARAMLETLPIVRFGDSEERPKKVGGEGDVELADNQARENNQASTTGGTTNTTSDATTHDTPSDSSTPNTTAAPTATPINPSANDNKTSDNSLSCSICTEDFTPDDSVRVLPCNHKFHPACVDPWLLDVSGTCPLCRVDLRPPGSNPTSPTSETPENTDSANLPPPLMEQGGSHALTGTGPPPTHTHARRRDTLMSALHLRNLRDMGPEERIAALRNLRRNRRSTVAPSVNESIRDRSPAQEGNAQAQPSREEPQQQSSSLTAAAETDTPTTATTTTTWRDRVRGRFER
ncbi:MAG: hypothetical protein Q9160_001349 [Pyrenula sp. 1 TL-2023]